MRKKIKNIINDLSSEEFSELAICVGLADMVNGLLERHKISIEQFSKLNDMSLEEAYTFLRGTHNYDLKTIEKVSANLSKIFGKKIELIKINFYDTEGKNQD